MQSNGDFKAQLGDANQPGLSSPEQRLSKLVVGVNPYVTGTSLQANSPVFFGREQALGEILGTLRRPERPGCVSVLGERRIGKSSLLNQIYQALAAESGLVSVHATAQNWNHDSQQQFYTRIHACLANALGLSDESVEDYPGLRDFLLNQAKQGRRFVLLIDEFEIMAGNPAFDAYFFSNLRALADRPEYRLGFVTSSRKPLKELCDDHKIEASSFWNIFGVTKVLGLLAEEEARDLVVEVFGRSLDSNKERPTRFLKPSRSSGSGSPDGASGGIRGIEQPPSRIPLRSIRATWEEEIRPLTGCHPALIQIAADAHWNAIVGGYKVDDLAVTMRVREYLEDFWMKCNEDKAAKTILLTAANGQAPKLDYRAAKLVQRGLLTADLQTFSYLFSQVILESSADDAGFPLIQAEPTSNNKPLFDVFLSHNSQDKPIVRELAQALESRNIKVWLDEEQLIPGRPWQEALETIIKTTRTVAVLIGKSGLGPWEAPEMRACLEQFVKRKLPVIPVLLPDASITPELPLFLQSFTWVDLRGGLTEQLLDRLEWGITGIKPSPSPRYGKEEGKQ